jgi:Tfp pilus assembly protein PilF
MDRLEALKEIVESSPKDSFARYGLAVELAGRGLSAEALEQFDLLLKNDPEYTAGYLMSAQIFAEQGRNAEAATRLKLGVECAAREGNSHAVSKMQTMLDELAR